MNGRPAESILVHERVIAYPGWFDRVRMSIPFGGSPGFLALTDRRLVFLRGLRGNPFEHPESIDAELARRGGLAVAIRDIVDVATSQEITVAVGSASARLAVRVRTSAGDDAHTFVCHDLVPGYLGMDRWVSLIEHGRRTNATTSAP